MLRRPPRSKRTDTLVPYTTLFRSLQKFRLAAQGHGAYQPPAEHRERVATYFDPLPIWYEAFESAQVWAETHPHPSPPLEGAGAHSWGKKEEGTPPFPLHAITHRPMFMYHSWGSTNACRRHITERNYLYLPPRTGARLGIAAEAG